ncbi:MAG: ribonuclease E/G [Betaproteobacteria bacterium AqS2]|uniref:Ribonuclease G n=1 Tax=Candidatus Amphirhobacter heronislandensis TaxID=1732024 RepID=A0A930Y2S6_9GAMM|nr:ribonuclease E/G [Betaproteobacteria bacterium AqS2]
MRTIIISTANAEENRIAVLDNGILTDYLSVITGKEDRKLSIFAGVIEEVETSINACFVNIGDAGKKGFLQFADIAEECLPPGTEGSVAERIKPGMPILVQITKDSRSEKGPLLTTRIKLSSGNLILMPRERSPAKALSISANATPAERQRLNEAPELADLPAGHAAIVRSNGLDQPVEDLVRQKGNLLEFWGQINQVFAKADGKPMLIYENLNIVNICLTEYHSFATDEIICDHEGTLNEIKGSIEVMHAPMPASLRLVKPGEPVFDERAMRQIDSLLSRKVKLKSGGEIVIDTTEALVAIDINSKRSRSQKNIEDTALNTNIEAATEIALQLRLRNLAGIVVIDFIDMQSKDNQQTLLRHIEREFRKDRASITIGSISSFGLLEMTRQNIGRPLHEAHSSLCPHCSGSGRIPHASATALNVLDRIKETAFSRRPRVLYIELPLEPATYLLNEKREDLNQLRADNGMEVIIIPSPHLKGKDCNIRAEKQPRRGGGDYQQKSNGGNIVPDYLAGSGREEPAAAITNQKAMATMHEGGGNGGGAPQQPPAAAPADGAGVLTGITNFFSGLIKQKEDGEGEAPAAAAAGKPARRRSGNNVRRARSRGGRGGRGGGGGRSKEASASAGAAKNGGEGGGGRRRSRPPRPQPKKEASSGSTGGPAEASAAPASGSKPAGGEASDSSSS